MTRAKNRGQGWSWGGTRWKGARAHGRRVIPGWRVCVDRMMDVSDLIQNEVLSIFRFVVSQYVSFEPLTLSCLDELAFRGGNLCRPVPLFESCLSLGS